MSFEQFHNEALTQFEVAEEFRQIDNLVRALFHQFQKNGYWSENLTEYCRRIQMSDAECDAESKAFMARIRSMTEEERTAYEAERKRSLGNLEWISRLDEFGLCQHTRINPNDMVIHAFCLGYGEPGRSNDPTMYVIYRPGDEDDYNKVYVVRRKWVSDYRAPEWTCEPIQEMYKLHCQNQADAYAC